MSTRQTPDPLHDRARTREQRATRPALPRPARARRAGRQCAEPGRPHGHRGHRRRGHPPGGRGGPPGRRPARRTGPAGRLHHHLERRLQRRLRHAACPGSDWKYDTGPGSSFGTGEIETMTNSTANVYEDGNGHLVLKALHSGTDPGSGWTSGRIETQAASFGARRRRRGDDAVLDPAAEPDHGQRRRLLARVLDARLDAAHRHRLAGLRRGRHPGGHQRPQLGLRHAALRRQPGRPVQRVHRHRLRRARLLRLPDRLPHLRRADRPLGLARADPLVPRRAATTSPSTPPRWTPRRGRTPWTTRSSSSTTWRWAAASPAPSAAAPTPPPCPAAR